MTFAIRTEVRIICQYCKHELDSHPVEGFYSMLGPPIMICPKCGNNAMTDRIEWIQMNWFVRLWYIGASLLYTTLLVLYGSASFACVLYFWYEAFGKDMDYSMATFWPGAILWGSVGAGIQIYRVFRSLRRTAGGEGHQPVRLSLWNLDMNIQNKMLAAIFIIPIAAWLLSFPVQWLVRAGGWHW